MPSLTIKPGEVRNPNGRPKGVPNKMTRTVRQAFEEAFEQLQADPTQPYALGPWGKKNPDKFYLLSQKLIPTQVAATVDDVSKELDPTARAARLAALTAVMEARAKGEDVDDLA